MIDDRAGKLGHRQKGGATGILAWRLRGPGEGRNRNAGSCSRQKPQSQSNGAVEVDWANCRSRSQFELLRLRGQSPADFVPPCVWHPDDLFAGQLGSAAGRGRATAQARQKLRHSLMVASSKRPYRQRQSLRDAPGARSSAARGERPRSDPGRREEFQGSCMPAVEDVLERFPSETQFRQPDGMEGEAAGFIGLIARWRDGPSPCAQTDGRNPVAGCA